MFAAISLHRPRKSRYQTIPWEWLQRTEPAQTATIQLPLISLLPYFYYPMVAESMVLLSVLLFANDSM
ncbi:hypothetical protein [Alicyclobacillus acidoterrestris]|uniref:Uncharacterized protein n=1 Tax=Alicyclobacillus acidoterrestris (strain ATCC 49025 / DSM 3922 / CIP 106132 / NCIMB 13137 / GD3B) TaxID=1356854 RepID=T0CVA7_ALIAG|nr:hypothetical protein [Alicyclobacillus acidoterrestris]EPZ43327.1 hypothetical protein N007_13595 [Alicyclobacillus acidoterrestris ATCC 49025]UNO47741.1 hypothetical protein K1I37_13715 [Alicyclobacillus acidoterrestris]GEO27393.1 hypothetical protein AAC03nite_31780 [Alicyclobacillus acidoterrestris]